MWNDGTFSDPKCYCCNRGKQMKLRVQAQYLQPGDVVGSGEVVTQVIINSTQWPSNKVRVSLNNRAAIWGKHIMINVERND